MLSAAQFKVLEQKPRPVRELTPLHWECKCDRCECVIRLDAAPETQLIRNMKAEGWRVDVAGRTILCPAHS